MFDNKLSERQKIFSKDKTISNINNTNSLIRKREEMNLQLRKNKLFDKILERRLNNLNCENSKGGENFNNKNQNLTESNLDPINLNLKSIQRLEIEIRNLKIPEILKSNYYKHPDKLSVISKLFNDENVEIDVKKFAIVSLRKLLCEKKEKLSQVEIAFIYNNLYKHLLFYLLEYKNPADSSQVEIIDEIKIKYETSWILINLTSENEKFCEDLLDVKNLQRLDEILEELINLNDGKNLQKFKTKINTNDLIRHILWIFSNLLGENSQSNIIVRNTLKLQDRLDYFFKNTEYVHNLNNPDIKNVIQIILWLISNLMRYVFSDARYIYKDLMIDVINLMKYASVNSESLKFNSNSVEIVRDCLDTLFYFTNCEALIPVFIENDTVPLLINAFSIISLEDEMEKTEINPNQIYEDVYNIVKLLSEMLTVEDKLIDDILKYPVIEKFIEILLSINSNYTTMIIEEKVNYENDSKILKEVCLAISNITASSQENIEKIILNEKIVEILLQVHEKFGNSVKYEIYHIFYNAFHGGSSFIRSEIIRKNIHRLYIDKLNEIYDSEKKMTQNSVKIIKILLEAFLLFLEFGDKNSTKINFIKREMENENIVSTLEKLQYSQFSQLYDVAHKLLIRYWTEDECYYEDPSDILNIR